LVLNSGLRPNSGLKPESRTKLWSKAEVNLNDSVFDLTIVLYLDRHYSLIPGDKSLVLRPNHFVFQTTFVASLWMTRSLLQRKIIWRHALRHP